MQLFPQENNLKTKRLNILRNILILGKHYILNEQHQNEIEVKEPPILYLNVEGLNLIDDVDDQQPIREMIKFYKDQHENKSNYNENIYVYNQLQKYTNIENQRVQACFSTYEDITQSIKNYNNLIQSSEFRQNREYQFHSEDRAEWKPDQYKKFLLGFQKYMHETINNKKIAKFIDDSIKPNHVRYIKGKYIRNLKKRARVANINLKEQLKLDIENFDIGIFQ